MARLDVVAAQSHIPTHHPWIIVRRHNMHAAGARVLGLMGRQASGKTSREIRFRAQMVACCSVYDNLIPRFVLILGTFSAIYVAGLLSRSRLRIVGPLVVFCVRKKAPQKVL
ncbi:MAG TPA: hypothetical protein VKB76_04845 [Ktedonobacterales bacterium]|nr:hypothetical protein [Ktedonobacterales bacterium]